MDDRETPGYRPRATILQASSAPLCAARALSWFGPHPPALQAGAFRLGQGASWSGQPVTTTPNPPSGKQKLWDWDGRVVGRGRVELPQHRGGAFTAPWVRQYPAYPDDCGGPNLLVMSQVSRGPLCERAATFVAPNWRKAEVLIPNGCPSIPLRTGARLLPD